MEPGHEDREYAGGPAPVPDPQEASMEPGHEDREYNVNQGVNIAVILASMEPGHEDREYRRMPAFPSRRWRSLNGARP